MQLNRCKYSLMGLLLLLAIGSKQSLAAEKIDNIRIWNAPDHSRIVFDLSGEVSHRLFRLTNPERLVLDISGTGLATNPDKVKLAASPIIRIRSAPKDKALRVVMDLKYKVKPKSFVLAPNKQYGHRLVIDLFKPDAKTEQPAAKPKPVNSNEMRDIIVVLDAGHGGEDPGAIGPARVLEKRVVFAIAKKLKALFDKEKGFKAYLTRTSDYYVSLRRRTDKARKLNADLFLSIHADAFKDPRASGASVWVLSSRGASGETGRWLADKENSADLIGGVGSVSLNNKDDVLASVLLDMSMTASRANSREVAQNIHKNMDRFAKMHKPKVQQASFVVLKSPDIPSVLIETGFISNPGEARKLKSSRYQSTIAKAVFKGVKTYFEEKPPALTYLALKKQGKLPKLAQYKVVRGDTLSHIAKRNGVTLKRLKEVNKLKTNVIHVGQSLLIPVI